jgi:phage/plasmid-like protein (TIGR03299 family)
MSHEVENMFYVGETPWHGLGTPIPAGKKLSIEEGIVEAGQNWEVGLAPLCVAIPTAEENPPRPENLENNEDWNPCDWANLAQERVKRFATYRKTDGSILGTVGPHYRPLQNIDAFKFFEPILEAEEAELHTAGSLCGGAKVWILAQLNRDPLTIGKTKDEIIKFLLLSNSHDGTTSVRVGFTPIRTVCANTLAMAHRHELSTLIRIRHGKQTKEKLEKIREIMDVANATFEATAEQYRLLDSKYINQKDLETYVKVVLEIKENKEGKISTKGQNIIDGVLQCFAGGEGADLLPKDTTWWRAYNAVNTRLNHYAGRNRESRLNGLWFGGNANVNHRALSTAIEMVS